jgi:hypothetical protein
MPGARVEPLRGVADLRREHALDIVCRNFMTTEGSGMSRVLPPLV